MILYLHGADTYRLHQRLHYYREGFKKKYDPQGYNVTTLDGVTMTLEELRRAVGQAGFLASKRLVIVENVFSSKKKKLPEEIARYLSDEWSDDNVLIFTEEEATAARGKKKAGSKNPLRALLSERAQDESFEPLTGAALVKWIQQTVRARGGSIAGAAAGELAAAVGSDLWQMASEIEKLVNLKDGKPITVSDVQEQVHAQFDENIFHLTDALAARDGTLAMKLLNGQLAAGSPALYILTMLIRQFRILLQVQAIAIDEPHPQTIATRLKLHPFVVQKAVRDVRRFSPAELTDIYRGLVEADIALKTTQQDPRLVFDLLVTRICTPAQAAA